MSSILTNNSAMVALQTLNSINKDLLTVQSEISTGKTVGSAKDNSAVWAISSVMKADVEGFRGISESLSLGSSTVAVGRQATETITGLLTEIKGKIVAGQEETLSPDKVQTDIAALRDQITSVVNAAQFNGVNLLKGDLAVEVLSSLDRDASGTVTSSKISIKRQNLEMTAGSFGTGVSLDANATLSNANATDAANSTTLTIGGTVSVGDVATVNINDQTLTFAATATTVTNVADGLVQAINLAGMDGVSAANTAGVITISNANGFSDVDLSASGVNNMTATPAANNIAQRAETVTFADPNTAPVVSGDSYRMTVGGTDFDYIASDGDTYADVARGLKNAIDDGNIAGITTGVQTDANGRAVLAIDNSGGVAVALVRTAAQGGTAEGGLHALASIDVSTEQGQIDALTAVEGLIQESVDSAAEFGTVENRLDIQNEFVSTLSDALTSGIGALVDADMEEASARLQALQVQQQLGIQALSIANQAPQNILSLFR